jgi:type 1 glutamine amidotransferase
MISRFLVGVFVFASFVGAVVAATPHKILIVTGQSNRFHDWSKSSPLVKTYLEQTGLFTVDVATTPARGGDMSGFSPKFSDYAAVVLIYEGDEWPAATKQAFVDYMKNGGGLVTIHDTDNAFPYWPEFNEMIAVGGWGFKADGNIGARNDSSGAKLRLRDGKWVQDSATPGTSGHPARKEFPVTTREPKHPIMQGLPETWIHGTDEIYSQLRGPAKNVTVLASSLSSVSKEEEPMLMAISYGKGRIFHSTLGHVAPNDKAPFPALVCAGFITTLQRGTEWAATGKVTQKVPADFPTAEKSSLRTN